MDIEKEMDAFVCLFILFILTIAQLYFSDQNIYTPKIIFIDFSDLCEIFGNFLHSHSEKSLFSLDKFFFHLMSFFYKFFLSQRHTLFSHHSHKENIHQINYSLKVIFFI